MALLRQAQLQEPPRQTIKTLAAEIKRRWPELDVRVDQGYCTTDRKVGRLRWPGKGRYGARITVRDPQERGENGLEFKLLLKHNNAETYRHTGEVRRWIDERVAKERKQK